MTMEKQPFEDASPTKHGDFALPCEFSGVNFLRSPLVSFLVARLSFNYHVAEAIQSPSCASLAKNL